MPALPPRTLSWLYTVLQPYHETNRTYEDVVRVLETYPTLSVRTETYTSNTGASALLLLLPGVLPVMFHGQTYNFPINIWVPEAYPREPPMIYVVPTKDMLVNPGQHVDPAGQVYHPYLSHWSTFWDKSTIFDLLTILRDIFAKEAPVKAKVSRPPPQQEQQTPAAPPPIPPLPPNLSRPASQVQSPAPAPAAQQGPPPPPPKGNGQPPVPGPTYASPPPVLAGPPAVPPIPPKPHSPQQTRGPLPPQYTPGPQQPQGQLQSQPELPPKQHPQYVPPPQGSAIGPDDPPLPPQSHSRYQSAPPLPPDAQRPAIPQGPVAPGSQYTGGGMPHPSQYAPGAQGGQPAFAQPPQQGQPPAGPPPPGWQPHLQQQQQQPRFQPQPEPPKPKAPPPPDLMDADDMQLSFPAGETQVAPPPIPPNPEKDMLLHQLAQTLHRMRLDARQNVAGSLQGLEAQRGAMNEARTNILGELQNITTLMNRVLLPNISGLNEAMKQADKVIADSQSHPEADIDGLLVPPNIVANQLYGLVAEERALGDAVFVLGRAVERGRVTSAVFAKSTRQMGREWYLKKALIRKVGRGMGLTGA